MLGEPMFLGKNASQLPMATSNDNFYGAANRTNRSVWPLKWRPTPLKWIQTPLCTYQRPSRGGDPGEPPGICTKTFTNSTYPGPVFFHKKLPLSPPPPPPREHNLKGLPNCNVISWIIFNKSLTILNIHSTQKQLVHFGLSLLYRPIQG